VLVEGLLAGGTSNGRVGLWKYSPSPGITEPEDQWQLQAPSAVAGPVLEVSVCVSRMMYSVAILLSECQKFFRFLPVTYQIDIRTANFREKFISSDNCCVCVYGI